MWTSIIGIVNGLLGVVDRVLSFWLSERERQAGRNEVRLEAAERAIKDEERADEIDARPAVRDRSELLKRLWNEDAAKYYLGKADLPRTGND